MKTSSNFLLFCSNLCNEVCLLLYMCNMVFLVHPQVFVHLPCEQSNSTKAHPFPYCRNCCGESLYAPIINLPDVFLDPSHLSCHLSSYYSLNSQMKLLFHLTRSWIAWARNLEAGRLFLLSAARRMWKWSSVQVEGPHEIYWHALCKMVASW